MDINSLGSSETTREPPFTVENLQLVENRFQSLPIVKNFTFTKSFLPKHKKEIDFSFLEWFIGFTEGDGCFCSRIEGNRPRLSFEIVQKDAKLMYKIRTTLGFGKVLPSVRNNQTYWKYSIEDKQNLQRIMLLFNGNLVLPKRCAQFKKWVTAGKLICPETFVLKNQRVQVCLKTGWLSGFIEAEGCFYANLRVNQLRLDAFSFNQKLTITQKDTHGECIVLQEILFLFQSSGKIHIAKKPNCYRIQFDSLKSQAIIIDYFCKFPLLGNKKIAFLRWWRIYLRRQKKTAVKTSRSSKSFSKSSILTTNRLKETGFEKPVSLKTIEKYKKLCLMINKKDFQ